MVLWRVAKRLSYTEDARCLKVKNVSELRLHSATCLHDTVLNQTQDARYFQGAHLSATVTYSNLQGTTKYTPNVS